MTLSELETKYQAIVTDCLNEKITGDEARTAIITLNFEYLNTLRGLSIVEQIKNRKMRRSAYSATWRGK